MSSEFLQCLQQLFKDCNFKAVSTEQNRENFTRDAIINGLLSNSIRQHLLHILKQSLTCAQRNSSSYNVCSFVASTTGITASKQSSTEMMGALQKRQEKMLLWKLYAQKIRLPGHGK